jgi:hypothetical protein
MGKTRSESIKCQIGHDEKEGLTLIAAIDATGNKLPLSIIGSRRRGIAMMRTGARTVKNSCSVAAGLETIMPNIIPKSTNLF